MNGSLRESLLIVPTDPTRAEVILPTTCVLQQNRAIATGRGQRPLHSVVGIHPLPSPLAHAQLSRGTAFSNTVEKERTAALPSRCCTRGKQTPLNSEQDLNDNFERRSLPKEFSSRKVQQEIYMKVSACPHHRPLIGKHWAPTSLGQRLDAGQLVPPRTNHSVQTQSLRQYFAS